MKANTNGHTRVGTALGLLLLIIILGIFIAQAIFLSAATPLSAEPVVNEPRDDAPSATPLSTTPLSLMPSHREISGGSKLPKSPTISFIDSTSATCSRPVPGTGSCYIQWDYLYVTAASSSYVISMTVAIDGHIRAYHSGFFQTFMYIPSEMTAPGYKMTCGTPGSGGVDGWGNQYTYAIRARETSGLSAANYGSVTCPADTVLVFLPFVKK